MGLKPRRLLPRIRSRTRPPGAPFIASLSHAMGGPRLRQQTTALPSPETVLFPNQARHLDRSDGQPHVRRAVERPPYFAFAFAVVSLFVIPEGDLLLFLPLLFLLLSVSAVACFCRRPERSEGSRY